MFNRTKEIERMTDAVMTVTNGIHNITLTDEVARDMGTKIVDTAMGVNIDAPIKGITTATKLADLSSTSYFGCECFGSSEDLSVVKRGRVTITDTIKRVPVAFFFLVYNPVSTEMTFLPFMNMNGEIALPHQITVMGKNHP